MFVIFGSAWFGRVDRLGPEHIRSRFVLLVIPLIPVSSFYVLGDGPGGERGHPIPLHLKSVFFGYVRTISWLVAFVCAVAVYLAPGELGAWAATLAAAGVAAYLTFRAGGLSARERRRREALRAMTGCGAPPMWLPEQETEATAGRLSTLWGAEHGSADWEQAIRGGAASPLLLALAEYHGRTDLSDAVLRALEASQGSADSRGGAPSA